MVRLDMMPGAAELLMVGTMHGDKLKLICSIDGIM
jgi:hypothetical protein